MLFLLHKPICDFMSTKFRNKQLIGKRGALYIVPKHVYFKKKRFCFLEVRNVMVSRWSHFTRGWMFQEHIKFAP